MGTNRASALARCFNPRRSWTSPESVHRLPAAGRDSPRANRPQPCGVRSQSVTRRPITPLLLARRCTRGSVEGRGTGPGTTASLRTVLPACVGRGFRRISYVRGYNRFSQATGGSAASKRHAAPCPRLRPTTRRASVSHQVAQDTSCRWMVCCGPAQCGSGVRSLIPSGRAEHSRMHEPVAPVDGVVDRSHARFRRELAVVHDVRPGAERLADLEKHVDCLRRSLLIDGQAGCF